jgi:hypothetical protein
MRSQALDDLLDAAVSRLPLSCDEPGEKTAVRLGDGEVWSAAHPAKNQTRLRCAAGALWVTQAGQPGDVVLHPGQSFDARAGGGKVVVQALDDATFWVE